ncbi:MAG: ROK family protein [Myxococcales bacterium]
MPLSTDPRTVLTLDAGGTNFVFNAIRGGRLLLEPITLPSRADDLEVSLGQIRAGFDAAFAATGREVAALSFAFPGPADYRAGVIGDLGNLPGFRGGVALGPMLADRYGVPVFINNDGDLFAYGEALGGLLPWVNGRLERAGSPRRFRNLIGFTLGTGLGGGVVHDGKLLLGDNSAAGEAWLLRHRDEPRSFAEEGASIRAVRREYARSAGIPLDAAPEPREIAAIARSLAPGDARAAREAYRRLGEVAGDAAAQALTLVDGLVALGGGLSEAAPLFMPALLAELNGSLVSLDGKRVSRLELAVFDLDDARGLEGFLSSQAREVRVPGSARTVRYDPAKRAGVGVSRLGTSAAISLGAYAFALDRLDVR